VDPTSGTSVTTVLAVLAGTAALGAVEAVRHRSRLHRLGVVLDPGSARVHGLVGDFRLAGSYRGRAVEFRYESRSGSSPERLGVSIHCEPALWFEVGREGAGERLAHRLGLLEEAPPPEPGLVPGAWFLSPRPDRFRDWLHDSREAASGMGVLLGRSGFRDVGIEGRTLRAVREGRGSLPAGPDDARRILEALSELAEAAERP